MGVAQAFDLNQIWAWLRQTIETITQHRVGAAPYNITAFFF